MFVLPTVAQFKTQFVRDFPYGTDPNISVLDADISNAFLFAEIAFNPNLFYKQPQQTLGFLLLAAHYMVLNLRASSQGLNGQYNWAQNSKSVNNVSEQFEIPDRIKANPDFMMLTKTQYGGQYFQLVLPQLCGLVMTVQGFTKP